MRLILKYRTYCVDEDSASKMVRLTKASCPYMAGAQGSPTLALGPNMFARASRALSYNILIHTCRDFFSSATPNRKETVGVSRWQRSRRNYQQTLQALYAIHTELAREAARPRYILNNRQKLDKDRIDESQRRHGCTQYIASSLLGLALDRARYYQRRQRENSG